MTAAKVAVSIPVEVLALAKKQVKAGRAKSLSAFITEAVDEKVQRDELAAILDAMDAEHGKPGRGADTWVKRILRRSSSMRAR